MRLPDFFHVGPPKTGTTGLRATLASVPGIALSTIPEPSYFAFDHEKRHAKAATSLEAYAALFASPPGTRVIGDLSPVYLHSATAPQAIHEAVPSARIVICLRHPVERAFSHFLMWSGTQPLSLEVFDDRLAGALAEPDTPSAGREARFARCSLYADAVERFFTRFGKERVLVLPYDRLVDSPQTWMRDFLDHIGLADVDAPARVERRYEGRAVPESWTLHRVAERFRTIGAGWVPSGLRQMVGTAYRKVNRPGPTRLDPETVDRHFELFRQDVRRLGPLTGIDFEALWSSRSAALDTRP